MKDFIYKPNNDKADSYKFKEGDSINWSPSFKCMDENFKTLMRLDKAAKKANSFVGRVIRHPMGDGQAFYQVIKESKKACTIRVCVGIGDDWVLPAWGEQCTIPKETVYIFIGRKKH